MPSRTVHVSWVVQSGRMTVAILYAHVSENTVIHRMFMGPGARRVEHWARLDPPRRGLFKRFLSCGDGMSRGGGGGVWCIYGALVPIGERGRVNSQVGTFYGRRRIQRIDTGVSIEKGIRAHRGRHLGQVHTSLIARRHI